jgi:putative MATE family efflux protein
VTTDRRARANERRLIAGIAVPVSLEFVLTLVLNFINQVIVGVLGATAIAAVGFANSFVFILIITFGALGVSVSILVARAFGGQRRVEMSHTLAAALIGSGLIAFVGALVPVLWPEQLLSLLGASPTVAAEGAGFLRLTAFAMLPTVLVSVLSGALRSTGHARVPMAATLVTVPLTTALSYGLVLGVGPLPELGVTGAGWAVLITTVLKLAILVVDAYAIHRVFDWSLPDGLGEWRTIIVPLFVLAIPLGITELLWSTGTFLYNVIAQQLGDAALASLQIASTMEAVFFVGSIGLMSATTALIGQSVGHQDVDGASHWAHRLVSAGVYTGVSFGALLCLSAFAVPLLYGNAGRDVQVLAIVGIVINGLSQVIKVRNMILGAGVMPSGGDVKGVILGDAVGAFAVGLPLAIILALFTPLGVVGLFVARVIEEMAKLGIFTWRTKRISWSAVVSREALSAAT